MVRRMLVLAMVIMLGLQPALAGAQEAPPIASPSAAPGPFSEATQSFLQQSLETYGSACPGAVLYVESSNARFHQAQGVENRDTQAPLDPNARFQIGSNTKMMTSTVILQLYEEGRLSLDDPMAKWLPEQAAALGPDITVRQLLNHTSGLYDYFGDIESSIYIAWERNGDTTPLTQAWSPEEIVDYLVKYRATNAYLAPGAEGQWHYSSTNYIILGIIIERITGGTYADALQGRIFDPLEMSETSLLKDSPRPGQVGTSSYHLDMDATAWNLSQGWAAGGVVSTPRDMATFIRALLAGKLFQDPTTLELMKGGVETPYGRYGLGLLLPTDGVWGHFAQTVGYTSTVAYSPSDDLVLVGWSNCGTGGIAAMSYQLGNIE